jgi:uncharacterized protein YggE
MSLRQESRYPWFDPRLVTAVVIAGAIVWSTSLVTHAWQGSRAAPEEPKVMPVSASATRHLKPERMTWTITVHGRGDTAADATSALRDNVRSAHDFLIENGISEAEIAFKGANLSDPTTPPDSDSSTTTTSTVDDTQEIAVTPTDFARGLKAHNAAAIAADLTDADVNEPTCTSSATEALSEPLLVEARAKVAANAEMVVAQYGGGSLGKLVSPSQGALEIGNDCSEIVVTATANANYQLD